MLWGYVKEVVVTSIEAAESGSAIFELILCIAGVLLLDWWKRERPSLLNPLIKLPFFANEKRRICTVALSVFVYHVLILAPYRIHLADQVDVQNERNKVTEDYISENRAYLEAEVVIDSVTQTNIQYHFEIENKGKLPATSILYQSSFGDTSYFNGNLEAQDLGPSSKMNLEAGMPRFGDYLGTGFHADLTINFQSKVHGETKNFKAKFVFYIPEDQIKTGRYSCDHAELDQSGITDLNIVKALSGAFKLPVATLTFVTPSFIPGTLIPNIFQYVDGHRIFIFDGGAHSVVFKTSLLNGTTTTKVANFSDSNGVIHVISLRWGTNDADIFIDAFKAK